MKLRAFWVKTLACIKYLLTNLIKAGLSGDLVSLKLYLSGESIS